MKNQLDMKLNTSFIKSVLTIWDEMATNGMNLVYMGEFNQEITKTFTKLAESSMERNEEDRSVKRKVYHVMVETLQNLNKHSDEMTEGKDQGEFDLIGNGMFMIGKKAGTHYIITANKISEDKAMDLQLAVDQVNYSSKDELKEMYKKQIKGGEISERGGAGLGLIDIARKTGEKIEYQFLPHTDDKMLFIMKVEIK